jgi:ABC-2 type transport system permease protein
MLWKVLRPRWWLLRRQLLRGPRRGRLLTAGVLLAVLAGTGWAFDKLVQFLAGPAGTGGLVAVVPGALATLLMFALIQLSGILYQFYLAPDIVLLQAAPVPPSTLYLAKLLACTPVVWLPAGMTALVLLALGMAQAAPLGYYLLSVAFTGAAASLATSTGVVLVMLVAGLLPPQRLRRWLPAAFAVATLGVLMLQQEVMGQLARWGAATHVLAGMLLAPDQLAQLTLVIGAAALGMTAVGWRLFKSVYPRTVDALGVAPPPMHRARQPVAVRAVVALAAGFPAGQRLIVTKEWLCLLRDPQRLTGLVLIPLVMAVLLIPILADREAAAGLRALSFWLLLVYAALFGLNAGQGAALPAFTLEGRRLQLLRQTPITMRSVLWGKYWAALLPAVLAWWVVLAAYGALLGIGVGQIATLLLAVAAGLTGVCAVLLPIGALGADFAATAAQPKLARGATPLAWLGLLLGAVWQGGTLALCLWLVLALGQGSTLAALTRVALSAVPPLGALGDPSNAWLPLAALAAWASVALVTAALWRAAQHRLANWEPAQT